MTFRLMSALYWYLDHLGQRLSILYHTSTGYEALSRIPNMHFLQGPNHEKRGYLMLLVTPFWAYDPAAIKFDDKLWHPQQRGHGVNQ